jgi:diguanylate cyclase (GGDEF)-like protein
LADRVTPGLRQDGDDAPNGRRTRAVRTSGMTATRDRARAQRAGVETAPARHSGALRRRGPRLDRLLKATRLIGVSRNARELTETLKTEMVNVLAGADCRIDVHLDTEKMLSCLPNAVVGDDGASAQRTTMALDPVAQRAIQRGVPTSAAGGEPLRLVIPLLSKGEPWGFVDVRASRLRAPDKEEAAFLQLLADSAAATLERVCQRGSVADQGITDGVTGFFSRPYFLERLRSETVRARRYRQPLSAVVFEIDGFEEFVSRRGQAVGMYLLRAVGRLLKGSLRQRVDIASRFHGGKFALLLPNTPCSTSGAALVAERLRNMLEATEFRDDDDQSLGCFTLSAGVAGFPSQCDDADELAAATERALALAQRTGNRVKIYVREATHHI